MLHICTLLAQRYTVLIQNKLYLYLSVFSGLTVDLFALSCTARVLVELEFSSPSALSWNE